MSEKPLSVYPAVAETDEDLDVPEFRTDNDDSYVVKIDKIDDENESNQQTNVNLSPSNRPKSGFTSLVTAIRVAKWLAKAYGYVTQKKLLYAPQDTVIGYLNMSSEQPNWSIKKHYLLPKCRNFFRQVDVAQLNLPMPIHTNSHMLWMKIYILKISLRALMKWTTKNQMHWN